VQPEETPRAQREDTPSPTPPPDDPFSTSSIDLVMGSPIQDTSKAQPVKKPSNARREETPSAMASPDDPAPKQSLSPAAE